MTFCCAFVRIKYPKKQKTKTNKKGARNQNSPTEKYWRSNASQPSKKMERKIKGRMAL